MLFYNTRQAGSIWVSRSWINQTQLAHTLCGLPLMCVACRQYGAWRRQVAGVVAATHQLTVKRVVTAIEQVLDPHADLIIFTELVLADHIDGGVAVDLASSKAGNAIQAIISASK